jgi:hypothetical protein
MNVLSMVLQSILGENCPLYRIDCTDAKAVMEEVFIMKNLMQSFILQRIKQ